MMIRYLIATLGLVSACNTNRFGSADQDITAGSGDGGVFGGSGSAGSGNGSDRFWPGGGLDNDAVCGVGDDMHLCAGENEQDPRAFPDDIALRIARMNAAAQRLLRAIDLPGWQKTYTYMAGGPGKVIFGLSKRQLIDTLTNYLPIWRTAGPPPTFFTDAASIQDFANTLQPRDFTTVYAGGTSRQYRFMHDDDMQRMLQKSDVVAMGFSDWGNQPAKENASDQLLEQFDMDGCVGWKFDDPMLQGWLRTNYPGSMLLSDFIHAFPSPNMWDPLNVNVPSGWNQAAVVVCRRNQAATGFVLREVQENVRGQRNVIQFDEGDAWKAASRSWVAVYAQQIPLLDGRDLPFADRAFKAAENTVRGLQGDVGRYAAAAGLEAISVTPLLGTALAVAEGNWGTAAARFLIDVATFTVVARGPAAAVLGIAGATGMVIVMTMPDQRNCGAGERDQRVVAARGGWVERMRVLAAGQGRFPCAAPAGECAAARAGVADINDGVAAICGMDNLDAPTQLACTTRVGHFPVRDWTQDLQGVDINQCPGT